MRERQTDHICANDGGTKTLLDLAQLCIQCRWERVRQSEWGERRERGGGGGVEREREREVQVYTRRYSDGGEGKRKKKQT